MTASGPGFRIRGAIEGLAPAERARLFERSTSADAEVRATVAAILARVRAHGDDALHELAREFDGASLSSLEVPRAAREDALARLAPGLRRALERAARNLEVAHAATRPRAVSLETEPGVEVGRRPDPLARVGLYAPGGRAEYPSSVLMGAVPARVAGVGEIILCSPPGPDGLPPPAVLAAAELTRVDRVFALGGAGAIAAMAWGTASVPRVDRIVGPGNAWVAEAKLQVAGQVSTDAPAGPSECLVLADQGADPAVLAREVLAQAEHDPRACTVVVLFGPGAEEAAARVAEAIAGLLEAAPRRDVITRALAAAGALLTARDASAALAFAGEYAPEHLVLACEGAGAMLPAVRNAGTVYVGASSSGAFGDYLTGANHILPTGGLARSYSGVSTLDFVRWTSWQRVSEAGAASLAADVGVIAEAEGLFAHAAAARAWLRPGPAGAAVALEPWLDLSDNTNRFGSPPAAAAALAGFDRAGLPRYPSPRQDELRAELARRAGVDAASIVAGCGSDDLIDAALRAFSAPGDRVAFLAPTFVMVERYARANGREPIAVPPRPDGAPDLDALIAARPRIAYLCSPNNPTGAVLPAGSVERVLDATDALVVLDEAYGEFADIPSLVPRAAADERLLVARTFSKAFGLAGMRVGWMAGTPGRARAIAEDRGPFRVGVAAEAAALAALRHDESWMRAQAQAAVAARERFTLALRAAGFAPLPSKANFVLVPVANAETGRTALAGRRIAVRAFAALPGIGDALRITVGPWPEMERVLAALEAAFAGSVR